MAKETLDFYDENLNLIGTAPRERVHKEGLLHQVVHCWVIAKENNKTWIYFQQRSFNKKDFPGLYDFAVTGHIDAGEDKLTAVLREMREEIGARATPEQLVYLGKMREEYFFSKEFIDREVSQIYLYSNPNPEFKIGEEVERMIKVSSDEFKKKELGKAESITAYTLDGKPLTIKSNEWCSHKGEFEKIVLPNL